MNNLNSHLDINESFLVGTVRVNPELKHTQNNSAVLRFRVQTISNYTGSDGMLKESKQTTTVNVWGQKALSMSQVLREGSRVAVQRQPYLSVCRRRR